MFANGIWFVSTASRSDSTPGCTSEYATAQTAVSALSGQELPAQCSGASQRVVHRSGQAEPWRDDDSQDSSGYGRAR